MTAVIVSVVIVCLFIIVKMMTIVLLITKYVTRDSSSHIYCYRTYHIDFAVQIFLLNFLKPPNISKFGLFLTLTRFIALGSSAKLQTLTRSSCPLSINFYRGGGQKVQNFATIFYSSRPSHVLVE